MQEKIQPKISIKNGYLLKVIPVLDEAGNIINHTVRSFKVELHLSDVAQIIIGATLLSIPLGFTEETWKLGESLSLNRVLLLSLVSVLFIGLFLYLRFYKDQLKKLWFEYIKRILVTYGLSLIVVGILLTIIDKCPWGIDNILAIKRIIIVSFPASMSATLSDALK
ncbi:DUF2391 domain-containing protein [Candidatus Parcubacteria bacterium]|nr:MAG: DUF2391 domain-containing protein [Candidatus Parcubacteria bacterium]